MHQLSSAIRDHSAVAFPPLGESEQLRDWSGRAIPWGEGGRWETLTFGGGVIDRFVDLLRAFPDFVAEKYPGKAEAFPVVLGCVPWLNSDAVVDALLGIGLQCVCVDKGAAQMPAVQRLANEGEGVWQAILPGLEYAGPRDPDGRAPVVHPAGRPPGDRALEPVRLVGWQRGRKAPLLHAKLAVLCAWWTWETDYGGTADHFTPLVVWTGSANWTTASANHVEFGASSDDKEFASHAFGFIVDLIRLSEPPDAVAESPEPQLVEGDWDDDAFAEYAAVFREQYEDE